MLVETKGLLVDSSVLAKHAAKMLLTNASLPEFAKDQKCPEPCEVSQSVLFGESICLIISASSKTSTSTLRAHRGPPGYHMSIYQVFLNTMLHVAIVTNADREQAHKCVNNAV